MNGRNYGIDLLKSISMLMVVVLHILGVGGVLAASDSGGAAYYASWFLETLNICAVNCFGLVSGYVLCKGRYRASRLFSLWLRVVAEALLITLAFSIIIPAAVGRGEWLNVMLPVMRNVYWYFTAYFALFFFVPYINKMLKALSYTEMKILSISVVLLFCVLGNISKGDIFQLNGGYGFLWLMSLYILGAILRFLPINPKVGKGWFLLSYAVWVLLAFSGVLVLQNSSFISYTSPFILFAAISLLLFFRRLEFRDAFAQKLINLLSRTSFGVYIIHTNPLIWNNVLSGSFAFLAGFSAPLLLSGAIGSAVLIYSVCTLMDWLVEKLFKLIRVDKLEAAFDALLTKGIKKLQKPQKQELK